MQRSRYRRAVVALLALLPFAAAAQGSMTLTWTPPTTYTDGSPLNDLAGYRVYWGPAQGAYSNSTTLANPGLTGYVIDGLAPATYYSAVTAYNAAGVESAFSNVVSKIIQGDPIPPLALPGPVRNLDVVVVPPGAGYLFVRWRITGRRGATFVAGTTIQVADFELSKAGVPIAWPAGTVVTNPGGSNPSNERPPNLVDNNAATKALDFNFAASNQTLVGMSTFAFALPAPVQFDGYRYRTGNDAPERDPLAWQLEGSQDGLAWSTLAQLAGVTVPLARGAWTATFQVTP